ncbi:hypothetical protein L596_018234 [Steinernema carpocapsae]|uniref:Uncharacterized protein n=1 Tax=Steinernema carpocapsae TaxID=34508 RepID=A0A4U5N515_STECR|nr:hypothetical protein L596_018234 [Steinernema carpocapsae]
MPPNLCPELRNPEHRLPEHMQTRVPTSVPAAAPDSAPNNRRSSPASAFPVPSYLRPGLRLNASTQLVPIHLRRPVPAPGSSGFPVRPYLPTHLFSPVRPAAASANRDPASRAPGPVPNSSMQHLPEHLRPTLPAFSPHASVRPGLPANVPAGEYDRSALQKPAEQLPVSNGILALRRKPVLPERIRKVESIRG